MIVSILTRFFGLIFLLGFGGTTPAPALASRYEIKDAGFRNSVHFISDAPLETIVGISNFVSGWLELDPLDLKTGIRGVLEIDARTFETGNPARNVKIRELVLGAPRQPILQFTVTQASGFSANRLTPGRTVTAKLAGILSANGVETKLTLPVRLMAWKDGLLAKKRMSGNLIQLRSDFTLRLSDINISVPQGFQGSINPDVKFSLHVFGTDRLPSSLPP